MYSICILTKIQPTENRIYKYFQNVASIYFNIAFKSVT